MNLFKSKDATPPTMTGEEVLREALRVRFKRGPVVVGIFARELGVGVGALEDFANGKVATLSAQTLDAVAKFIFGDNAGYDAERNLLTRVKQIPKPGPARSPPLKITSPPMR